MKGRVLGGRYQLDKRIGEGGMGVVYKGRDTSTDEVVAVKIIRSEISSESRAVQRFLREAKAAGSLNHPSIVRFLDEGIDGDHYIVMEYVQGVTIREWVRTFGRSARYLVPLICDILAGLYHAHSRGIIHRDIKPENVIVTHEKRAKLMDFGLARPMNVRGATITQEGAVVGTVAYMSPEQASGKRGDERSDLYSLGVLAYELFSGRRPFVSDSPMNILIKHIQDDPVPPRRHNPGLPEAVEAVILRLLAKRPEDRFRNALEALEAFRNALVGTAARRVTTAAPSDGPTAAPAPAPSGVVEEVCVTEPTPTAVAVPVSLPPPDPEPEIPRVRRLGTHRGPSPAGVVVPGRRPRVAPAQSDLAEQVEVTLLYTRVQGLQEMLDHLSALQALEIVGVFDRTVEALATIHRGRVLEGSGSTQVMVFEGNSSTNPVGAAAKMTRRLKQVVAELPIRIEEIPPTDLFLSAGIYSTVVRVASDTILDDVLRRDGLGGARRLHDISASERRYAMLCEASWKLLPEGFETQPFKRLYISGRPEQVQVYELLELPARVAQ